MTTPATLASVATVATNRVRATFTAAVRAWDPGSSIDATNPANWTLTGQPGAYVPPIVRIDAVVGDDTSVDLNLLEPLDAGQKIDVTASSFVSA